MQSLIGPLYVPDIEQLDCLCFDSFHSLFSMKALNTFDLIVFPICNTVS
jgi:hypothetical protein